MSLSQQFNQSRYLSIVLRDALPVRAIPDFADMLVQPGGYTFNKLVFVPGIALQRQVIAAHVAVTEKTQRSFSSCFFNVEGGETDQLIPGKSGEET